MYNMVPFQASNMKDIIGRIHYRVEMQNFQPRFANSSWEYAKLQLILYSLKDF